MIEIFRKNIFVNSLLLLPYVCLLRIHSLIEPQLFVPQATDSPVVFLIYNTLGSSALLHSILAIFLIFFQAALINRIIILNRLENESTLFAGVFYIIFASSISEFLIFSPLLIGMTFILFSISELFRIYKKPKSEHNIFSSGFWVGIAALFYPPYLLYFIVVIIGLMILRSFKLKQAFQAFTGLCIPFFLLGTILFWNDSLNQMGIYLADNFGFFEKLRSLTQKEIILFISLGMMILSFVLGYGTNTSRKSIQIIKKIDILYWGLFVGVFAFGLRQPDTLSDIQFLSFPICVFLGFLFQKIDNRIFAEMAHLVILTAIIIGHFQV